MQPTLTKSQGSFQTFNHCGLGDVGVLVGLGLSGRQARVYLALLRMGDVKATALAKRAQVNQQDIYRITDSLQKIGLIQRNIAYPTTFTATPIGEVLQMLLEQKTQELTKIQTQTKQLTQKYSLFFFKNIILQKPLVKCLSRHYLKK